MRKVFYSLIVILLLSSCITGKSKPSNFYNLVSYDNSNIKIKNKKRFITNIEQVVIPAYLDRPQIITLNGEDTEFNISETNRWAEPLASSIQRTLARDIYSYMPNSIIRSSLIGVTDADYHIYVIIDKFDGRFGDKLTMNVWWSVLNKNGKILITKNSSFEGDLKSNSYNDLIKEYSKLVNQLAIEIGNKINSL